MLPGKLAICSAAILLMSMLTGCSHDAPVAVPGPVPVITIAAEPPTTVGSTTFTGIVKPHRQVDLDFRVSGYVKDLLSVSDASGGIRTVQEGDRVAAGTVLAQLTGVEYRAQAEAAAAQTTGAAENVDQAESRLTQAIAARQQALFAVTEAKNALSASFAQRDEAKAGDNQASTAVSNAQSQLALAQDGYERANSLYQSGSATKPQLDQASSALDSARSALQAAVDAKNSAASKTSEAGDQISAARARVMEAETAVEQATAAVSAGKATELAAESQAAQAQAQEQAQSVPLSETSLVAPFSGVVLMRRIDVGGLVAPGVPVFVLADTSRYDIVFGLPNALRPGQSVTVMVDDRISVNGTVTEIAPASDEKSGVTDVTVTVSGADPRIKSGLLATLVLGGRPSDAGDVAVPLAALVPSKDQTSGFAVVSVSVENGQSIARLRDVSVEKTAGDTVIVRGLSRGTVIVASAPGLLYDGEPVQAGTADGR